MPATAKIWLPLALGLATLGGFHLQSCLDDGTGDPVVVSRAALGQALSGAIFTTTEDGSLVNANIYEQKEDVYLDGGPGPGAPAGAAGLPAGDYYFQVTDPSGKTLLSTDAITCRRVRINAAGVIDYVYPGTDWVKQRGSWQAVACQHEQGVDSDHSELGAVTVQLMPYDDTPNRGGVYKVWLTPTTDYEGNTSGPEAGGKGKTQQAEAGFHGFVPARSKTDNYKVHRRGPPAEPMTLSVRKFHDADADGARGADEQEVQGWQITALDPLGASNHYFTPVSILTWDGTYLVEEATPARTLQTVALLDGEVQSALPDADPIVSVVFEGAPGETHEVVYGDVGLGSVRACKVFDRDGDGEVDDGEPTVSGWHLSLSGTTVRGDSVGPLTRSTGADGCATYWELLPGTYVIEEVLPTQGGWVATGATSQEVTIESSLEGSTLSGTAVDADFTNRCLATADFDTKGYWHNKNGLAELTAADLDYVNGLDPYDDPTSYFGAGDEPFDGHYQDGTEVAAPLGESGSAIAPAGSPQAEVSLFLVDANASGDPREQLAQQLLAFLFNTRHRLDGGDALIALPAGGFESASELVDEAIAAWQSGTAEEQHALETLLDTLNNSDEVSYVPAEPCPVTYP